MPLDDSFLLTQLTIDFIDGAKSRAHLSMDPDDRRGRGLDVIFLNVGEPVDMTGAFVSLYWQHDVAPALRGLEAFEPVDATVGRFKVHYPADMGRSAGTVSAKIMVAQDGDAYAVPLPPIDVNALVADPSAAPSGDTFSVLGQLVTDYQRGEAAIDVALERVEEATAAAQDVADRAARGEFDGKGLELAGAYDSIEELREAVPSPSAGEAAVAAGTLYVWDGSDWSDQGAFTGPKGDTGDPAGFGTLTVTVDAEVGEPSVDATWDGPDEAKDLTLDFHGLKGETGRDGTSVTHRWDGTTLEVTSASGTSSADLKGERGDDGVSVTHEWQGTTLEVTSASGTSSADLKGDVGPKGDPGEGLMVLDSYDDYDSMVEAHPEGDRVGDAYMVGTHYYVWNGSSWADCGELRGAKGDTGAAAGFGRPTAQVGDSTGDPTVSVEASGEDTAKVFAFSFDGLKGETGETGPRGSGFSSAKVTPKSLPLSDAQGLVGREGELWDCEGTVTDWDDLVVVPCTITDEGDARGFFVVRIEGPSGSGQFSGTALQLVYGEQGPEGPEGPEGPKGDPGDPLDSDQRDALLKEFLLAAHPVGSYYWSDQPTSPQTLFGGTWEAVEGRFVWAKSSSESVNETGGYKTVTLTEAQMPSHSHSGPSHSHSLNSHSHSVPSHSHGLNSHTHGLNSHTHSISHTHKIPAHNVSVAPVVGGSITLTLLGNAGVSASDAHGTSAASPTTSGSATGSTAAATGNTGTWSGTTGTATGNTGTGGTGSTGTAGSGSAHENMPPYVAAYCWKRTA